MKGSSVSPGTRLILVRHGETEWNLERRVQGHRDVPLSARGVEQALRLRSHLREESIDWVYSSDLQRARRTAEILAEGRNEVRVDPRLREAGFGLFEGLTSEEMAALYPEEYRAWRSDSFRNRPPSGESLEDLGLRALEHVRECLERHPGQSILVVAHGGPIRVIACELFGWPLETQSMLRVENSAVSRIGFGERGPLLEVWNDTSHLKAAGIQPEHAGWEEC